jgi:hypothetical protein
MRMIWFILFATLLLARDMSGYDSRYNNKKYFVLKNKSVAEIILPKTVGFQRGVKRKKADFYKMTYTGLFFYLCNLLLIFLIPLCLLLVPEIQVQPYELETRYIYILVDTLNQKLPVLFSLILLSIEIIYVFINIIAQAKKQNKKWLIILSMILVVIFVLFGLLHVEELISTIIEVS